MTKPLLEFNRAYAYRCYREEQEAAALKPKGTPIRSAIFYGVLIAAVAFAFVYRSSGNAGLRFGPFAYNTVLTSSMKSVYPQGSIVTSWALGVGEPVQAGLDKGTDIVFVIEKTDESGQNMVVVHRIIEIMDNYEESGQRAFLTQGVDNPLPDDWVVYEGNIIGRVTWHAPYVGDLLAYVAEKFIWIIIVLAAAFALLTVLKIVFKKEELQEEPAGGADA